MEVRWSVIVGAMLLFLLCGASVSAIERVEGGYLLTRSELEATIMCDEEREILETQLKEAREEIEVLSDHLETEMKVVNYLTVGLVGAIVGIVVVVLL